MKISTQLLSRFSCFFFFFSLLLIALPISGAQFNEEVSTDQYLFINGMVRSISLDTQQVTVKEKKGPSLSFTIDQDTVFEGFYKLEELKMRQQIKVWYQPKEQGNRALKIEKPLDLGC